MSINRNTVRHHPKANRCGEGHTDEASSYRVVGLGHVLEEAPSVGDVLDLAPNEEAERVSVGAPWVRSLLTRWTRHRKLRDPDELQASFGRTRMPLAAGRTGRVRRSGAWSVAQ